MSGGEEVRERLYSWAPPMRYVREVLLLLLLLEDDDEDAMADSREVWEVEYLASPLLRVSLSAPPSSAFLPSQDQACDFRRRKSVHTNRLPAC